MTLPAKITVTIATRGPSLTIWHDDVVVVDYQFAEFKGTEPDANPTAMMRAIEMTLFPLGYHPDFDRMRLTDDVQVLTFNKIKG